MGEKNDTNNDNDSNIDEEMPLSSKRLGYVGNSKRSNYSHKSGEIIITIKMMINLRIQIQKIAKLVDIIKKVKI